MPSAPTSPVNKFPAHLPRPTSVSADGRLTPATIMRRKAEAERRISKLRELRMKHEETRTQLKNAEADAGRSAAKLRTTLRELDYAVLQLREAREKIHTAVVGKRVKAHELCVEPARNVVQVRAGGARFGMMLSVPMRPVAGTA
eukprot:GFKZ01010363.1.p1 GENE.GFKZ01010363.1~~GFKZ01010363.1.p1  ORF type:complete len:144 (-),score=17.59 GFKZ01010363.1:663-1094(-)